MDDLLQKLHEINGYDYQIWNYQLSFSRLTLRATKDDIKHHNIHITFVNVSYFQFPTGWTGDLHLANDEELLQISKRAGIRLRPGLSISFIKENLGLQLYKADSPNGVFYILGHLSNIEYDVEPIYN